MSGDFPACPMGRISLMFYKREQIRTSPLVKMCLLKLIAQTCTFRFILSFRYMHLSEAKITVTSIFSLY